MKKTKPIQYTIRSIPPETDRALRLRARKEGKSLNELAIEALRKAAGQDGPVLHHDLDFMIGTWVEDPAFDVARAEHEKIDWEKWG